MASSLNKHEKRADLTALIADKEYLRFYTSNSYFFKKSARGD